MLAAAVAVMALAAAPPAEAKDPREAEARTLFFKGEYQRALDLFAAAYADNGDPILLRNIGRCHQKLQQPDPAIEAFRSYLRRNQKVKPAEREEIGGFIREMEALKAKQAAQSPPPVEPRPGEAKPGEAKPGETKPGDGPAGGPPRSASADTRVAQSAQSASPDLGPQQPSPPPPPPAGAELAARPTEAEAQSHAGAAAGSGSIAGKWWFWTGIGALVVGGVVTALLLSGGGGASEPACPTTHVCPRN